MPNNVFYTNAQSTMNTFTEVVAVVGMRKPDIVANTASWTQLRICTSRDKVTWGRAVEAGQIECNMM